MAVTTTTVLSDTIPTIIEEARYTMQHNAVIANLVWKSPKKDGEGSTKNFPYWGTVSAYDLTENVDMSNPQSMADTTVTITPSEVGAQIVLTDKLVRDNQEDVKRAAGRILGDAMAVKQDSDLAEHFSNGGTDLGSDGTMTMGQVAAAVAILAGNPTSQRGPAPRPYVMVHHPYCLLDLVDVLTPLIPGTAGNPVPMSGIADEVVRNYNIGRLFGVDIYEDGNLSTSGDACDGAVFASGEGGSIILCEAKQWDVEPERDASLRATELNIVGEYGSDGYNDNWIVEMSHDATAPD